MNLWHTLNLIHRPVKYGYLLYRCLDCGKVADADPFWAYAAVNWRENKAVATLDQPALKEKGVK